jgi:nitrilase
MMPLKVCVLQVSAGEAVSSNLARFSKLFRKTKKSDLVVLPEVFAIRTCDDEYKKNAECLNKGTVSLWCARMAREHNCWLLAGSILERSGKQIYNTSILFDRRGKMRSIYRKMHLFEAHLEDGRIIKEADIFSRGKTPVVYKMEGWSCGFSICYDVRFPELYRHYARSRVSLIFIPANFTQRTGKDHWDILVKARAIENQTFVIAANQCGKNERTGVASYGHSMIVGPWGEVLAEADGESEMLIKAELDPALLNDVRKRVPCLKHAVAKIKF